MGDGKVNRIVVATGAVDQTVNVGSTLYGLDISPDGRFLYVALRGTDQVVKIEVATGTVVDTFNVGAGPYDVGITPDGKYLFVANHDDNTVTRIQLIADGNPPGNGPSPDLIPPGGPPHQLGGGGNNIGPPQPPGHTWQPNGAGGTPQSLTMALANLRPLRKVDSPRPFLSSQ
jgi:YVTN family beta-propeller protein